jgi:uncharacterized membrane protein
VHRNGKLVKHNGTLAAILILGAVLRAFNLTGESAWLDEIWTINYVAARDVLQVVADSFRIDYHPFAYYLLLDIWGSLFGLSDFSARALSVLIGSGAILSACYLTRTFFGNDPASLLCAFFTAVSPVNIAYSQEARMYILLLLLWPLFLISLHSCRRTGFGLPSSLGLFASFTSFAYAHATSGLFALPLLVVVAGSSAIQSAAASRGTEAKRAAAAMFCCAAAYLPWIIRLLALRGTQKQLGGFGFPEAVDFLQWILFKKALPAPEIGLAGLLVTAVLAPVLFRWGPLLRRVILPAMPLLASIAAVFLLQFLLSEAKPTYQPRNIIFVLPVVFACISLMIVQLLDLSRTPSAVRFGRGAASAAVIVVAAAFSLAVAGTTVKLVTGGPQKEQWREAVRIIQPQIGNGDILVFHASFTQQCWDHYAAADDPTKGGRSIAPPHQVFAIPWPRNQRLFNERARELIHAALQLKPTQSMWVFYSHVGNGAELEGLLKSSNLRQNGEWKWNGILLKNYTNPTAPQ